MLLVCECVFFFPCPVQQFSNQKARKCQTDLLSQVERNGIRYNGPLDSSILLGLYLDFLLWIVTTTMDKTRGYERKRSWKES